MIHPCHGGIHPKVRMIGHDRTRYFFSGAVCLDVHPTDDPMDHPRITLQISEPDRDDTIILESSQGVAPEARTPVVFHVIILGCFGQTPEIAPSSYYHPTFRHSRKIQKAIILSPSCCFREHPARRGYGLGICKSNHSKYQSSYPVG